MVGNLDRLQAVADYVARDQRRDISPKATIAHLRQAYGAKVTLQPSGNTLRCAGVTGSCTWSEDKGLLASWSRNATVRLMKANFEKGTSNV